MLTEAFPMSGECLFLKKEQLHSFLYQLIDGAVANGCYRLQPLEGTIGQRNGVRVCVHANSISLVREARNVLDMVQLRNVVEHHERRKQDQAHECHLVHAFLDLQRKIAA